jgi:DnaJ-class molecular chaperone
MTCPKCHGRGEIEYYRDASETCQVCGGTGSIEQEIKMDTQKFIGLTENEAVRMAAAAGLTVVVNKEVPTMLTASMKMDRLKIKVENGVVVSASIG